MNKEEKNSNKCPICGRPTHKESKYCIFHASAEEKTEEEFKKALKEYINKIKKVDGNYNFSKFIFVGSIIFKEDLNINVFKNALFFEATFERDVFFLETTFEGKADFFRATFKGDTYFTSVPFEGKADFLCATFEGKADFTGATFKGNTDFRSTVFVGNTYFTCATFEGNADFTEATFKISTEFKGTTFESNSNFEDVTFKGHTTYFTDATFESDANFFVVKFKGNANFEGATFKHDAIFEEATFENDVDFRCKYFSKNLNFSKIKTFSGKKLLIKLINEGVIISFDRAYLENTYLDIELVEGVLIDFNDALLRNTKIKKDQIKNNIFQKEKKKYYEAQETFLLLKNNFHSIGQYKDESWAFKKERDMERKSNCHFRTLHKWLWSCFLNGIFGYGEQPGKVILSAILVILLFASLFMIFGISNVGIELITTNNFFDCIYFSTVTFTTLGYGDFRPLEGLGRILAGSEAFLGAIMMALFVYTFARRTGGR